MLFIADLHLCTARPAMTHLFCRFLAEEARHAAALYILGDLFEYWLGDDDRTDAANERLVQALRRTADSGVAIRFVHGNRDFLFGRDAADRAGLQILGDQTEIDLFGRRAVVTHGDELCSDDLRYQVYRRRIRHPVTRWILQSLPLRLRRSIAHSLRARSESEKQVKPTAIMDVNSTAVATLFRRHDVDLIIHGHTHRPARHEMAVDGRMRERWVLPDWHDHGGFLRCRPGGIESVAFG